VAMTPRESIARENESSPTMSFQFLQFTLGAGLTIGGFRFRYKRQGAGARGRIGGRFR